MKESVQPGICHNITYNLQHTIPAVFDVGVVVSCTGLTAVHNDTNKFIDGSFVPQPGVYSAEEDIERQH